jgi:hypothetical protein
MYMSPQLAASFHRHQIVSASLPAQLAESWAMTVRIIPHEAVPQCGSFEVRYSDGRPSQYFYWDDVPSRRLRDQMTSEQALEDAKAFARKASGARY